MNSLTAALDFIGPAILTGIAAYLIRFGLHTSTTPMRWQVIAGSILLAAPCLWLINLAASGGLGGAIAFVLAIPAAVVSVITGLWIAISPIRWRKLAGLLIGIVFPVLLFASIRLGDNLSPEAITRRNSIAITQGLQAYYADNGTYPATLEELTPKYLDTLPDDPKSTGGWLYTLTNEGYALGYVYWVDKLGYSICLYTPMARDWNCLPGSSGPFVLGPTPIPTRSRSK